VVSSSIRSAGDGARNNSLDLKWQCPIGKGLLVQTPVKAGYATQLHKLRLVMPIFGKRDDEAVTSNLS
jgi:hypothetical protein